ncbi:MAG: RNA methyltransferase [Chitinophagaceae bacterium]
MLSRSESKYIQTLSHKKQRDAEGLFIVEGPKLADEVLNSHLSIKKIFALQSWADANKTIDDIVIIGEDELQKISNLQTANEVLMLVEMPHQNVLLKLENTITLALDGIQDPGNFGTIIRIADWFGIKQIICSEDCVELYNPKVIQSTMGSFIRVNIVYTKLDEYIAKVNVPVFGALLNGKDVTQIEKPTQGVLIIGNESKGIRQPVLPYINNAISIKRIGGAESLNAAVATGIILSHLV